MGGSEFCWFRFGILARESHDWKGEPIGELGSGFSQGEQKGKRREEEARPNLSSWAGVESCRLETTLLQTITLSGLPTFGVFQWHVLGSEGLGYTGTVQE